MARFSFPTCSFEDPSRYTGCFNLFIFTRISLFLSAHPILSRTFVIIRQMGFECYKTPSIKYRQHDGDKMSLARAEIDNSQCCCCLLEAGETESLWLFFFFHFCERWQVAKLPRTPSAFAQNALPKYIWDINHQITYKYVINWSYF